MLFTAVEDNTFEHYESYKERNFYYKVFAGYLFNELVPGVDDRKRQFQDLLLATCEREAKNHKAHERLTQSRASFLDKTQVTFDFHPIQWGGYKDHGEMSDMVVWMRDFFYSIEFKFLSNLSFQKDIETVQERIQWIVEKTENKLGERKEALQIVIVKQEKWMNSEKFEFQNGLIPCTLLFWEDLKPIIAEKTVSNFIELQLNRKRHAPQNKDT